MAGLRKSCQRKPQLKMMNTSELGRKYDQIAEWWNDEADKNNCGTEFVEKALNFSIPKGKALDIGCGGGRFIEHLKNHHKDTGIDVSSKMLSIAKSKHPNVELIQTDFYEWNTQEKFDLIIAWDSVFHAPQELQKPITIKMCELLHEQGIILFTAGGVEGKVNGTMNGVKFEYASLNYRQYLNILDEQQCKIIIFEQDQYPLEHVVFMAQKKES